MIKKILVWLSLLILWFLHYSSEIHAAPWDENDLTSPNFEINTKILVENDNITVDWDSAVDNANFALGVIIQRLMLFIGWFALLVMTIGAWFMIIHRGDDATLSKWKEIFAAGIIGLAIALLSYYMVSVLRFIIYS
jgi:hypothetical protein